jgi:sensor c-di-GMP phosphodiesterase-like protein
VYADCGKCVSEQEFNDCADQNTQLRKYLTDCIKMSKGSVQAIQQCQDESQSRAWQYFGWGSLTGGGVTGVIVILLLILL